MSIVAWALLALVAVYITIPVVLYLLTPKDEPLDRKKTATVIVLGDLGHSPRMNYHALSIAKCGYQVDLCGYIESKLMDEVIDNKSINIHEIAVVRNKYSLPFVVFAPLKVVYQHWIIFNLLRQLKGSDYLLVQNPPSIPILGVVRFFSLFVSPKTKVIIDWHNLGYSILALKFQDTNPNHLYVRIYKWYERFFGYRAFVHLTVTVGLGQYLRNDFGMNGKRIIPLYDRPAHQFKLISESERKEIIEKYSKDLFQNFDSKSEKILITSTSYTPDENLYILLEALEKYASAADSRLPSLRVIITGKGPMYDEIQAEIKKRAAKFNNKVTIHSVWLPIEDYPKIIGVADIGISLHESSSGWDLPMKIIDMFGCGIPVISVSFPAISELIKQNENGLIVETSSELAKSLTKIFTNASILNNLKRGAVRESRIKWDTNWTEKLGPLFGVGQYRQLGPDEHDSSSSSDDD